MIISTRYYKKLRQSEKERNQLVLENSKLHKKIDDLNCDIEIQLSIIKQKNKQIVLEIFKRQKLLEILRNSKK